MVEKRPVQLDYCLHETENCGNIWWNLRWIPKGFKPTDRIDDDDKVVWIKKYMNNTNTYTSTKSKVNKLVSQFFCFAYLLVVCFFIWWSIESCPGSGGMSTASINQSTVLGDAPWLPVWWIDDLAPLNHMLDGLPTAPPLLVELLMWSGRWSLNDVSLPSTDDPIILRFLGWQRYRECKQDLYVYLNGSDGLITSLSIASGSILGAAFKVGNSLLACLAHV